VYNDNQKEIISGGVMMNSKIKADARKVATDKGHKLGNFVATQYGTSEYYRAKCNKCGSTVQIEIDDEIEITGTAYTEGCTTPQH
jgi:hypothetical protein